MAEATEQRTRQDPFTNPDGKRYPVYFDVLIKKGDKLTTRKLRIVNSQDENLSYMAIDPQTGREVALGATRWVEVYKGLLNRDPPPDLARRVELYYRIKEAKSKRPLASIDENNQAA